MNNTKLELFVKEIEILINNENILKSTIEKLELKNNELVNTIIENNKNILFYEDKIINLNNQYSDEINKLKLTIKTLSTELNTKSSKSIWENTQQKIKEKDNEIDQLKKIIEFNKRQQIINSVNNTQINTQNIEKELFNKPIKSSVIIDDIDKNKIKKKSIVKQEQINQLDNELENELFN